MLNRAEILKQQFNQSLGLPWQTILPASRIEEILTEENVQYRNSVYTPVVTLWALMAQVLDPDKSLRNAVKRVITWVGVAGGECPSSDTGAYSKARQRFNETVLQRLIPETAESLEQTVPDAQQWCGRRVRVQDGTTVLMSDTPANKRRVSSTWQPKSRVWLCDCKTGGGLFPIDRSRCSGLCCLL